MLTQIHRGNKLIVLKLNFALQNSIAGTSAAGLRTRFSFDVSRPSREKDKISLTAVSENGALPPSPLRFFEKNRVKLLSLYAASFSKKFFNTLGRREIPPPLLLPFHGSGAVLDFDPHFVPLCFSNDPLFVEGVVEVGEPQLFHGGRLFLFPVLLFEIFRCRIPPVSFHGNSWQFS